MDLNNLNEALKDKLKEINEGSFRASVAAATALKAEMLDRIFGQGKDSTGGKIGSYSTKPYYADKESFIRKGSFKPVGKYGDKKFTTGKKKGQPHQSMYLKGGYKEFRDIQGRQTQAVDLKLSGSLFNAIVLAQENNTTLIGITSQRESNKRKGNEKHFGKPIFKPAKSDVAIFEQALIDEVQAIKEAIA